MSRTESQSGSAEWTDHEADARMPTPPPLRASLALDQIPATFRPFAEAILRGPDPAPGLIRLLGTVGKKAPEGEARDFALLLRRTLPQSARRDRVTESFLYKDYPSWYIRAVNDPYRNAAYRQALESLVTPTTIVFEVGTGSGLFAMMAARAGARHVYTCEKDPHVAAIARENIRRNGLEHRITLFPALYKDLRVGEHLPEPADMVIHEFVAAHFMVQNIGSIIQSIRESLLKPGALVLPSRLSAIGMLVGDTWMLDHTEVPASVEGFDVTGINLLQPSGISLPGPVRIDQPLSAASRLASFDLMAEDAPADSASVVEVEATEEGVASGVLQWVHHRFPDGSVYESRPDLACNWWPYFWPFPKPVPVTRGARVALQVETTATEVFIDLLTPSGG